jgi:hypothetical protein
MSYPVEEIPDEYRLYRRVKDNRFNAKGRPMPGAFTENGKGMSSDWSKYSTPEESLRRSPEPARFGIVSLEVTLVRGLGLLIEHTPRFPHNQAHTDVSGHGDDEEIRLELARLAEVHGPVPPPRKRHTNNS